MRKFLVIVLAMFLICKSKANDGAFFAKGNHLIPINESTISVKKEILTLKKVNNQFVEVTLLFITNSLIQGMIKR